MASLQIDVKIAEEEYERVRRRRIRRSKRITSRMKRRGYGMRWWEMRRESRRTVVGK